MRRFDDDIYESNYKHCNNDKLNHLREENAELRNRIAELEELVQTLININHTK